MLIVLIANIIVALISLFSAVFGENSFAVILLGGVEMILINSGFLMDGHDKLIIIIQLVVAVLFALLTGQWFGFLIFACLIAFEMWQVLVMAESVFVLYSITSFVLTEVFDSRSVASMLLQMILIFILSMVVTLIWRFIRIMEERRQEERQKMLNYSLSEMQQIQRNKELALQSFYIDKNARLMERENISRNIHNSVGHSITAAIMTLDAADVMFEKKPEEAHKRMNDAAERIRGSLESIRSALRALDAESEDVSVKDMMCFVDNIIDEFMMDTDRTCDKIYDMYSDDLKVPREHAEFLTGALSELLTNGVKHGSATHFTVKLSGDSSHIRLDVKDNGQSSFNEETWSELIRNGFGLKKLISYVERFGGNTKFVNDNGFSSSIELPIKSRGEEEK